MAINEFKAGLFEGSFSWGMGGVQFEKEKMLISSVTS